MIGKKKTTTSAATMIILTIPLKKAIDLNVSSAA